MVRECRREFPVRVAPSKDSLSDYRTVRRNRKCVCMCARDKRAKGRKCSTSVGMEEVFCAAQETIMGSLTSPHKTVRHLALQIADSTSTEDKICRDDLLLSPKM